MAKQRGNLDDIFRKTEPERPAAAPPAAALSPAPTSGAATPRNRTISIGVGLKESEVAELDRIVDDLDITRNALMRYAIRYFLMQYSAGSLNLARDVESPEAKKRLRMP